MRIRTWAAIWVLTAGLPALSQAADIPPPSPELPDAAGPVSSEQDWNGVYLGILLGYSFGQSDIDPGSSASPDGVDGGIYAGYNYEFNNWVAGVEVDALLSGVEGANGGTNVKQDWSGSARLRAGYSLESFLLYGTGGLAVTETEVSSGGAKDSNTHLGWTIGAGVESMITDNVTARIEYRHTEYEDKVFSLGAPTSSDLSTDSVRAGVGVKF